MRTVGSVAGMMVSAARDLLLSLMLIVLASWPASAEPDRRVALVIGNGDYKSVPSLPNPPGDAKAVSAAFKRLGFEVTEGYDLTIADMRAKIAAFSATLPDSKAAVVYYAGHGVSVDGENYLVPIDMVLKSPTDLDLQAIDMTLLLKQLKREERANVVIMDACRDNPFANDLSHARTRAVVGNRGLSAINSDLAKGTLIAFASDPNSTALDGKAGESSPFTKALLHHLEDPDIPIDTVMNRVRTEVWDETKNKQMPWVNTSLIGEFYLNPQTVTTGSSAGPGEPAPLLRSPSADPDRLALENRLWDSAERGNTLEDYQSYLESYPSGLYASMAKRRIARLTPHDTAAKAVGLNEADAPNQTTTALKSEIGTEQTEAALGFDSTRRREVQARLTALAFDVGGLSGTFEGRTRAAIIGWQKNHGVQPTGWLGPLQYSALKMETDSSYLAVLSAVPNPPPDQQKTAQNRSLSKNAAPARRHRYAQPQYGYSRYRAQPAQASSGGMDPASAAMLGGLMGGVIGHFR